MPAAPQSRLPQKQGRWPFALQVIGPLHSSINTLHDLMTNQGRTPAETGLPLGGLFGDGAVLQRDCPLHIWGWGPPSCRVRVVLADRAANGWISRHGDFRVVLPRGEFGNRLG